MENDAFPPSSPPFGFALDSPRSPLREPVGVKLIRRQSTPRSSPPLRDFASEKPSSNPIETPSSPPLEPRGYALRSIESPSFRPLEHGGYARRPSAPRPRPLEPRGYARSIESAYSRYGAYYISSNLYMFKSSSPAPLFSSDDSGEALDVTNYESPRFSKPKRKGAWYETENDESTQTTPEAKKAKKERKNDSGIYMMSDASEASMDLPLEHRTPFACTADPAEDGVMTAEHTFLQVIRAGLDRDCQRYDMCQMSLIDEDIKPIGELKSVIKNVPDAGNDLPVEGQYRSLVPELYINLGGNMLRRLTPSLFDLQHLTTLVLRDNSITELPSHISRLRNLEELDVALNRLTCLPYELLEMLTPKGKLQRLITLGNKLIDRMPQDRYQDLATLALSAAPSTNIWKYLQAVSPDHEALAWYYRYNESLARTVAGERNMDIFTHRSTLFHQEGRTDRLHNIAHTLPSYFDQAGRLLRGSPAQPQSTKGTYDCIVHTEAGAFGAPDNMFAPPTTTRVPSLLTYSLNTALVNISVDETYDKLDEYVDQPDVAAILMKAEENDNGGFGYFRKCHTCKRDYIVARAEWIEFWSICAEFSTTFHPFKVRVCSWGCVPPQMRERPAKELAL